MTTKSGSHLSGNISRRTHRACDRCRVKKSKCNGQQPCNTCKTNERTCVFSALRRRDIRKWHCRMQDTIDEAIQRLYRACRDSASFPGVLPVEREGFVTTESILHGMGFTSLDLGPDSTALTIPGTFQPPPPSSSHLMEERYNSTSSSSQHHAPKDYALLTASVSPTLALPYLIPTSGADGPTGPEALYRYPPTFLVDTRERPSKAFDGQLSIYDHVYAGNDLSQPSMNVDFKQPAGVPLETALPVRPPMQSLPVMSDSPFELSSRHDANAYYSQNSACCANEDAQWSISNGMVVVPQGRS